jgi:DNA-binding transcriptional MerR regulator
MSVIHMTQPSIFTELAKNVAIPDKLYFKIGEVAKLIGVEPYVLRYWETEFPNIAPVKSKTGQRMYRRGDVELIAAIRELLYGQKFTIDGAKKKLGEIKRVSRKNAAEGNLSLDLDPDDGSVERLCAVTDELRAVLTEMDDFLGADRF